MTKLAIIGPKPRSPADWVLARIRKHRMMDMDQEGHGRDAMLHWRDPVERLRKMRRAHTLVDDNPASG